MFNTPRALKGFLILAPHPKSLRQIGSLGFSERTPEVCTNLSYGRFVLCRERGGDRSIGKANLRKGLAPSMAGTLRAWPARLAPSSSKIIAPNRGNWGFRNELRKRVRTSHVGGSFCVGSGMGIEVLAEPIFVRGLPLLWKRHCRPRARASHPLVPVLAFCCGAPIRVGPDASLLALPAGFCGGSTCSSRALRRCRFSCMPEEPFRTSAMRPR